MGATAINPTYKALEIKHQLNDSGAKALVVLDSVYAEAGRILDQTRGEALDRHQRGRPGQDERP